jgi:hypothetical protein
LLSSRRDLLLHLSSLLPVLFVVIPQGSAVAFVVVVACSFFCHPARICCALAIVWPKTHQRLTRHAIASFHESQKTDTTPSTEAEETIARHPLPKITCEVR